MFEKEIKVDRLADIRYGHTSIGFNTTYGQIMGLLRKHGCKQIMTMEEELEGQRYHKIAFTMEDKPYLFIIPRVYIAKGSKYNRKYVYDEKIGIRIVFRFLETLTELIKLRILDPEIVMIGNRMVHDKDGNMTNVADYILPQLEKEILLIPQSPGGNQK